MRNKLLIRRAYSAYKNDYYGRMRMNKDLIDVSNLHSDSTSIFAITYKFIISECQLQDILDTLKNCQLSDDSLKQYTNLKKVSNDFISLGKTFLGMSWYNRFINGIKLHSDINYLIKADLLNIKITKKLLRKLKPKSVIMLSKIGATESVLDVFDTKEFVDVEMQKYLRAHEDTLNNILENIDSAVLLCLSLPIQVYSPNISTRDIQLGLRIVSNINTLPQKIQCPLNSIDTSQLFPYVFRFTIKKPYPKSILFQSVIADIVKKKRYDTYNFELKLRIKAYEKDKSKDIFH